METIVDGYNLIFSCGWHTKSRHSMWLESARNRLIQELSRRIEPGSRNKVTIVFDAKTNPIKHSEDELSMNGFKVVFARHHDEADSLIEEMINSHSAPKSLRVVSDDHRLQNCATRKKAISIKCEHWLEKLESNQRLSNHQQEFVSGASDLDPDKKNTRELESVDWMKEFSIDEASESGEAEPGKEPRHKEETFNPFPPGYGEELS